MTLGKTLCLLGQLLSNKDREHNVIDGDSLAWLAQKYGTTVKALKKLNNLHGDVIYSGSVLKIDGRCAQQAVLGRKANLGERNAMVEGTAGNCPHPLKSVKPLLKACPRSRSIHKSHPIPRLQTVRVEYGDTLADIAYDHGLSPDELQRLNNLRDENIFEGDVLAVSSGQHVRELLDLRSGQRRTNRLLFSRQGLGLQRRLGVGGPEHAVRPHSMPGNQKLEGGSLF